MTNRLTVVSCAIAAVFAAATLVQTLRLWGAQDEAKSLRAATPAIQKEARKTAGPHTVGKGGDDWTPVPSAAMNDKDRRKEANAKSDTQAGEGGQKTDADALALAAKKASAAGGRGASEASAAAKTAAAGAEGEAASASARSQELSRTAMQFIRDGNLDQALTSLQQSVQEDPKNTDAWRNLASVERQMGKTQEELSHSAQIKSSRRLTQSSPARQSRVAAASCS